MSTHRHEPDDDSSAPPRAHALAVSSGMVGTDPLRDDVLRALKRGLTEVTLWGDSWQAGLEPGAKSVEHVFSAAARAFKAQALAALGQRIRSARSKRSEPDHGAPRRLLGPDALGREFLGPAVVGLAGG